MPYTVEYDNKLLDAAWGSNHAASFPNNVYAAAYTALPDKEGGGTETTYEEYARVLVANASPMFVDAVEGEKPTQLDIDFPTPWGSVYRNLWSSATAYAVGDVVRVADGRRYEALTANTDQEPTTNADDWQLMAANPQIVAIGLHETLVGDNLVAFEELTDPVDVIAGSPLYVPAGSLVFVPCEG